MKGIRIQPYKKRQPKTTEIIKISYYKNFFISYRKYIKNILSFVSFELTLSIFLKLLDNQKKKSCKYFRSN